MTFKALNLWEWSAVRRSSVVRNAVVADGRRLSLRNFICFYFFLKDCYSFFGCCDVLSRQAFGDHVASAQAVIAAC